MFLIHVFDRALISTCKEISKVPKMTFYETLFISPQIEKNTIQILVSKLITKTKAPNILVMYNMLGA